MLRLKESFDLLEVTHAVEHALQSGTISFDAVRHLLLCHIEPRPPRLDMAKLSSSAFGGGPGEHVLSPNDRLCDMSQLPSGQCRDQPRKLSLLGSALACHRLGYRVDGGLLVPRLMSDVNVDDKLGGSFHRSHS